MRKVRAGNKKRVDESEGPKESGQIDSTAKCLFCGHIGATFYELQIRSMDEPATLFYTCSSCGEKWNVN